jgi:1-acyl-sn-glycerol-3-phosphate acyltransferase
MARRPAFLPPKLNPLVLGLAKRCLPWLFARRGGGIEVAMSDADLARLRSLKRQRLLLLSNHPSHFDPPILMDISRRLGEDFLFVAAREVFDRDRGFHGWLLQRCGCYSLIRGAVDRDSFAMTQKILAEGRHWLVIFIEGEVSMDNETLIPFESGVLSLALRAQDTLADTSESPIHVATVAMKARYKPGVERAIDASIAQLEQKVGLTPPPPADGASASPWPAFRERIARIGDAVLSTLERTYLLTPQPGTPVDARIAALRGRMLSKMESFLDLPSPPDGAVLDRVRTIRNKMDRIIHAYGDLPETLSAYERQQLALRQQAFADFYVDLARLVNFLTLRGGALDDAPPERFAEVVLRLEEEVHGKARLVHPRTVTVQVGEIVNLRDHLPAFRKDKRKTAAALADRLEAEMTALLRGPAAIPQETFAATRPE